MDTRHVLFIMDKREKYSISWIPVMICNDEIINICIMDARQIFVLWIPNINIYIMVTSHKCCVSCIVCNAYWIEIFCIMDSKY